MYSFVWYRSSIFSWNHLFCCIFLASFFFTFFEAILSQAGECEAHHLYIQPFTHYGLCIDVGIFGSICTRIRVHNTFALVGMSFCAIYLVTGASASNYFCFLVSLSHSCSLPSLSRITNAWLIQRNTFRAKVTREKALEMVLTIENMR